MLRRNDTNRGPGRPLSEAERRATLDALRACEVGPEPLLRRAADETRLFPWSRWVDIRGPRTLVAHVALASRADGITLGRRVYLRRAIFERPEGPSIGLVAHEVCHVAQVLREGSIPFYARYVAEYASGLAKGLGDRQAYLDISYEREARRVGKHARGATSIKPR